MQFSLLTDPWIRSVGLDGKPVDLSLESALIAESGVRDIIEPPMTRLAILRLLLAMNSSQWVGGDFGLMGDPGFLQASGLPVDSARSPDGIVSMQDGNNPALNPVNRAPAITGPDLARALVTAYFCDRGGLKARMPGLPISATKPLHMGQLISFRAGENLHEFLELNRVPGSDWMPWWYRPIDYAESFCEDMVQYLLWPWRRLQVTDTGVVIAPGAGKPGVEADPWSLGRGALRHLNGLGAETPEYAPADVTALVLSQATPVACWRHRHVEAMDVSSPRAWG